MSSAIVRAAVLALIAAVFFIGGPKRTAVVTADAQQAGAPKLALLVGINKYKNHPDIKNLSGTHNDVALMRSLLTEFGFKEELKSQTPSPTAPCGEQTAGSGIRTLCSEQATKQAILDAFDQHLVKKAADHWKGKTPDPAKGPAIFFYYSGHGAQLRDKRPIEGETESDLRIDEADGLDETIVPHDSDSAGTRDIRDDSFEERIAELRKYTSNITFMSDSCHSGTITRGGGMKGIERQFPDLEVPASSTRGGGDGRDNMFADASYVTISGSLPTQFSFERILPDPVTKQTRLNGLLTYHFAQQVRQNPGASYREIIGQVRTAITAAGENQTPQAEGDVDRPAFGMAGAAVKRAIAVKCRTEDGKPVCSEEVKKLNEDGTTATVRKIEMEVGDIVGARSGGSIVVYSPNAKELTGDKDKIASGVITFADAFRSEAEIVLSDPNAADLPPMAKVVLVSPSFRDSKRVVAIDTALGAEVPKLVGAFRESPFIRTVEEAGLLNKLNAETADTPRADGWEIAVVRGAYREFAAGRSAAAASKNTTPPANQQGFFITDRSGVAMYDLWIPADEPDAAAKIQRALESHVKAENIRAMANQTSDLNDKLKVEIVRYKSIRQAGSSCVVDPYPAAQLAPAGGVPRLSRSEAFHINLTNNSGKPLLIYIYSVDAAGAITLLYPPRNAQETLKPGTTFSSNLGDPCLNYAFDTTSPTGLETIKIIASEVEIQADLLTQPRIANKRAGGDSPLEAMLRQAGGGTRAKVFGGAGASWTAINVDYVVVP